MKKNKKIYKNKPIDNEKYKVECNDILQDNIHLNEFNSDYEYIKSNFNI